MLAALVSAACASSSDLVASVTAPAPPATSARTSAAPTTIAPVGSSSSTTVAPTPSPSDESSELAPPADVEPEPAFQFSIGEIDVALAERMTPSWRPGCPVGLEDLRYLQVSHWDFTGGVTTGELVVHRDVAEDMARALGELFAFGFPIERMNLVDDFAGDDDLSMAANNTSAFNCREVAWRPGVWSNHALGQAIDVNPKINPYVSSRQVLPPEGEQYADRTLQALGGIYAGDEIVAVFADIGWGWGGDWSDAKDWQHFSASGR